MVVQRSWISALNIPEVTQVTLERADLVGPIGRALEPVLIPIHHLFKPYLILGHLNGKN
jgi:hypothetical protein